MSKDTRDALRTLLDAAWNRFMDHECETPCEKCRSASDLMERGEQELALLRQTNADLLEALKGLAAAIYAVRDDLRDDYPAVSEKFVLGLAAIAKAEGR